MRCYIIILIIAIVVLSFYPLHGQTNAKDTVLVFDQIKPYITCLFYIDSATKEMRMCMPDMPKVKARLARRNLTNLSLLRVVWEIQIALLEQADSAAENSEEAAATEIWGNATFRAADQAMHDLAEARSKITDNQDYYELMDIRISQILSRDIDFLKPVLDRLEKAFTEGRHGITCSDCKEKFAKRLKTTQRD